MLSSILCVLLPSTYGMYHITYLVWHCTMLLACLCDNRQLGLWNAWISPIHRLFSGSTEEVTFCLRFGTVGSPLTSGTLAATLSTAAYTRASTAPAQCTWWWRMLSAHTMSWSSGSQIFRLCADTVFPWWSCSLTWTISRARRHETSLNGRGYTGLDITTRRWGDSLWWSQLYFICYVFVHCNFCLNFRSWHIIWHHMTPPPSGWPGWWDSDSAGVLVCKCPLTTRGEALPFLSCSTRSLWLGEVCWSWYPHHAHGDSNPLCEQYDRRGCG